MAMLQDRLRRIKKQEQEQERRKKLGLPPTPVKSIKKAVAPSAPSLEKVDSTHSTTGGVKATPPKRRINQVCGACGIVGKEKKCCNSYNIILYSIIFTIGYL